jgi:two-component system, NarL family, sensor kinase
MSPRPARRQLDGETRAIVRREVLRFAVLGVIGLVVLALLSLGAAVTIAREQSMSDARLTAEWLARTVVEPRMTRGLRDGDVTDVRALDKAFATSVAGSDVAAVRLWDPSGYITYSDDPRLMGEQFDIASPQTPAGVEGEAAEADLTRSENRYLDPASSFVAVDLPVRADDGRTYLFQIVQHQDTLQSDAKAVWLFFAPVLVASLALLAGLLLVLAIRMARRLSSDLQARQELLQQAIDASDLERRRIAAALHDGTVQNLAGLSYSLAGMATQAGAVGDERESEALSLAASQARGSVQDLRTLLVDIYPANLEQMGLSAALIDLTRSLEPGIRVDLDIEEAPELDERVRSVFYRVAREALANVAKHSRATRVRVSLGHDDATATLSVADDGRGFDPGAAVEGHLGLRIVKDLAASVGADLSVDSRPGSGTTVTIRTGV